MHVAAQQGILVLNEVNDQEGKSIFQRIHLCDRFYTSVDLLDQARSYQSIYNAVCPENNQESILIRPFLKSDRLYLRTLEESDIDDEYMGWLNDPEVNMFLKGPGQFPATIENMKSWLEKFENSSTNLAFAIMDIPTNARLGTITLQNIQWIHRTAAIGIMIGRKDFWGVGYGTEAQSVLIEFAFDNLGLNKVLNGPVADHIGSVKMAHKLGFKNEGLLRQHHYLNGAYCKRGVPKRYLTLKT